MSFKDRTRMPESEARAILMEPSNMVAHLLDNQDGTFSLAYHIVCDYCDFCETQGDARCRKDVKAVPAKEDIYEHQLEGVL